MRSETTKLIEAWFADHRDDGDFATYARGDAYSVIGPHRNDGVIIFSTKPAIVASGIDSDFASGSLGMIGRYGLPTEADLAWLPGLIGKHTLLFLGDMDPAGLMIFAWLRELLHPKPILHLGVNDQYVEELEAFLPESFIMQCTPSELKSFPTLEKAFPDFREALGAKCTRILQQGRKIELDAIVSALGSTSTILRPAARLGTGRGEGF